MLFSNAQKNSQGFSLTEILVVIVCMGILSAIAIPSFLVFVKKVKLEHAVAQVRGALQEAQRQAIRNSKPCTVVLDIVGRRVTSSCMVSGDRTLPDDVTMATNIHEIQITFGILGTPEFTVSSSVTSPDIPTDQSGKIVFFLNDSSLPDKKCIAISNTLGLTRIGDYSGSINAPNITDNGICTAS